MTYNDPFLFQPPYFRPFYHILPGIPIHHHFSCSSTRTKFTLVHSGEPEVSTGGFATKPQPAGPEWRGQGLGKWWDFSG